METKTVLMEARDAEQKAALAPAAKLYEEVLKQEPQNFTVLHRLMIIYRKLRNFKKELSVINKALKQQDDLYKSSKRYSAKIAQLSLKLKISTGLNDRKGNNVFTPPEMLKLEKRKEVVLKKMKS